MQILFITIQLEILVEAYQLYKYYDDYEWYEVIANLHKLADQAEVHLDEMTLRW